MLDATADAVLVTDEAGCVILANPVAQALLGYAEHELVGLGVEALMPARYRREHVHHRERFSSHPIKRPMSGRKELVALTRDGRELTVEIGLAPLLSDGRTCMLVTINDVSRRRQAEDALRESTFRYRSLFDNMLDGYAHCRLILQDGKPADFEYLAVNPAFERLTGLKDAGGRKVSEILPDIHHRNPELLETYARVSLSGEPASFETYVASLAAWFAVSAYRPAAGEFVSVFRDITRRKRAEEEVGKLSLAVDQSPVSIIITGLDARIQYVNPAFSLASGYSADEALGAKPNILKSGRTPTANYRELWDSIKSGKTWRGEFINRRKDGTEYVEVATISPVRQADGRITHYLAVKEDITELTQALGELRTSEERLRLAKNAAGLGIYDRDIASGLLKWDERMREIWGVGADETITFATFMASLHPDDRAATQAAIDRSVNPAGDGAFAAKYRVIRRDGSERHVNATGQVFFEDGRAVRLVGAVRDVTAKRRLEQKLRQQRSELEALLKQQVAAQTAAAIAHDLNQPLLSISAYNDAALRMLRRGLTASDKLIHALEASAQQAQRAGRTLHELIDFLHSGDIIVAPLDINAVVLNAIESARDIGCDGFEPVVNLAPDLPPVLGNRLQLQKVLVNLIHNGVEAMRDGGADRCSIAISVRARAGENFALISVQDGGPGLDDATAARIFDPFFTTKSSGIGLGLAISRALIEAHDGQLWVDGNEGTGATFHCTLPFAP